MPGRWITHCPTCRRPMHHNHRCPGAPAAEVPCPPPTNMRELIEQARREAAAPIVETLTLPLETP